MQVCAVIHHGGAGTTAAGLLAAKPTFVCPFFGDQFMWGEMVRRAGCGPPPCPIGRLTVDVLAANFGELTAGEVVATTKALAEQMTAEDGVANGLAHFLRSLPRHNMLSDVHLLLDPPELVVARYQLSSSVPHLSTLAFTAVCTLTVIILSLIFGGNVLETATQYYANTSLHGQYVYCTTLRTCTAGLGTGFVVALAMPTAMLSYVLGENLFFRERNYWVRNHLKVGAEVVAARRMLPVRTRMCQFLLVRRHVLKKWGLSRVSGCGAGLIAATLGTVSIIFNTVFDLYFKTDYYSRTHGLFGCTYGFVASIASLAVLPLHAGLFFLDRVLVGALNGVVRVLHSHNLCLTYKHSTNPLGKAFCFYDKIMRSSAYVLPAVEDEVLRFKQMSRMRQKNLLNALELAQAARSLFAHARLTTQRGNETLSATVVARNAPLAAQVRAHGSAKLGLTEQDSESLARSLERTTQISFSAFAILLSEHRHRRSRLSSQSEADTWPPHLPDAALPVESVATALREPEHEPEAPVEANGLEAGRSLSAEGPRTSPDKPAEAEPFLAPSPPTHVPPPPTHVPPPPANRSTPLAASHPEAATQPPEADRSPSPRSPLSPSPLSPSLRSRSPLSPSLRSPSPRSPSPRSPSPRSPSPTERGDSPTPLRPLYHRVTGIAVHSSSRQSSASIVSRPSHFISRTPTGVAVNSSSRQSSGYIVSRPRVLTRPITFNDIMEDELSTGSDKHVINTPPQAPPQRTVSISVIETPPAPLGNAIGAESPPAVALEAIIPLEAMDRRESYAATDRINHASV